MQEYEPLRILGPFLPILEQFARQYRMTVHYPSPDNLEEQARGAALCQLGFTNPAGQPCFIRLDRAPRGWHMWVQRWGLHGLIAGRSWDLPPETGPEQLRAALERARDFASKPSGE